MVYVEVRGSQAKSKQVFSFDNFVVKYPSSCFKSSNSYWGHANNHTTNNKRENVAM